MKKILSILIRIVLILIALLFITFGIIGIRDYLWHLLVLGIILLFVTLFWNFFKRNTEKKNSRSWKFIRTFLVGILMMYIVIDGGMIIYGVIAAQSDLSYDEEVTMLILGTDVKGDEPGDLLKYRLDTAIEYLEKSPNTKVIVSGKGRGEYTEAEVMEKYLTEHSIDAERIYQENQAQSTRENFILSKEIIQSKNLSEKVLVVTNNYHQLRASIYAEEYGVNTRPLSSPTTWYMLFPLSERERYLILTEKLGLSPDLVNKYQEIN